MKLVWLNRITILLSCLGIFVAGVMSYSSLANKQVPCLAGSSSCAQLASSPFGSWLGLPVAYYGFVGYCLLLTLGILRFFQPERFKLYTTVGLIISAIGTLASFWLTFAALGLMQQACNWCLASAGAMIAICLIHAYMTQVGEATDEYRSEKPITFGALGLVAAFALIGITAAQMNAGLETINQQIRPTSLGAVEANQIIPTPMKTKGNQDAKVTVVEFADIRCGGCRLAWSQTKRIFDKYQGRLRLGFRHFPIKRPGHENAGQAAQIAEFAGSKGKFFEYMDAVFDASNNERVKTLDGLISIATNVGLDPAEVGNAINADDHPSLEGVLADVSLALKLGIQATPTYLVIANGKVEATTIDKLEGVLAREPYASLLRQ
ncbi:MAG: thioredoxin domain-containing protein [Fimbriimonadaceae bacterium]|nr:thioredoxin domain-containing protein [Fimbriimonadaceae bacterium]